MNTKLTKNHIKLLRKIINTLNWDTVDWDAEDKIRSIIDRVIIAGEYSGEDKSWLNDIRSMYLFQKDNKRWIEESRPSK